MGTGRLTWVGKKKKASETGDRSGPFSMVGRFPPLLGKMVDTQRRPVQRGFRENLDLEELIKERGVPSREVKDAPKEVTGSKCFSSAMKFCLASQVNASVPVYSSQSI